MGLLGEFVLKQTAPLMLLRNLYKCLVQSEDSWDENIAKINCQIFLFFYTEENPQVKASSIYA